MENNKPYTTDQLLEMIATANSVGETRLIDDDDWKVISVAANYDGSADLNLVRDVDDRSLVLRIDPSEFHETLGETEDKFEFPVLFRISIAMMEFCDTVDFDRFTNGEHVSLRQRQPQLLPLDSSERSGGHFWDGLSPI